MAQKDWSDFFAQAYGTGGFSEGMKLGFEKWKAEQESDPKAVAGKLLPTAVLMQDQDLVNRLLDMQSGKITPINKRETSSGWLDTGDVDNAEAYGIQRQDSVSMPTGAEAMGFGGKIIPKSKYFSITPNPAEKKMKEDVYATQKQTTGQSLFQKSFSRSYSELTKKYPEIGEVGMSGWLNRFHARNIGVPFDLLPETKAFVAELKPRANQQARDVEGGRVTDPDRKIYADAYPNAIMNPSITNIRLASDALLGMDAKGGNISKVMTQLLTSEVDIDNKIAMQILEEKVPNFSPETHDVFIDDKTGKIKVVPKEK